MLDAYIIEQLRREQERSRFNYERLYIEPPPPPQPEPMSYGDEESDDTPSHGVIIIDYFSDPDDA